MSERVSDRVVIIIWLRVVFRNVTYYQVLRAKTILVDDVSVQPSSVRARASGRVSSYVLLTNVTGFQASTIDKTESAHTLIANKITLFRHVINNKYLLEYTSFHRQSTLPYMYK